MSLYQKRVFYSVSFAMTLVQFGCLLAFFHGGARPGSIGFRHLAEIWCAGAAAGIVCAFIGGGDPGKHNIGSAQFLALLLNGGFLMALGFFYVVSFVHD
jgi:hypothetical protein